MTATYPHGDRVFISQEFFWAKGATGTISRPPTEVTAISGPWKNGLTRTEHSALGEATVYWVGLTNRSWMQMVRAPSGEEAFGRAR